MEDQDEDLKEIEMLEIRSSKREDVRFSLLKDMLDHPPEMFAVMMNSPYEGVPDDNNHFGTFIYVTNVNKNMQETWNEIYDLMCQHFAESTEKHDYKLASPTWFYCFPPVRGGDMLELEKFPFHHRFGWYSTKLEEIPDDAKRE